ncbi:Cytochrome c oxidase assembly protein COX16 [Phytophthora infestans]|uniref:Cytochrome c oxidase assembly protein COX16 n=2 Tax=Phytophthora infestans TaxID=4787 RepID=A0A8S9UD89_PHYIN|nr:Cytochrome c oxidase assembly protein COX16 [Phytophthora infestans]
MVRSGLRTACMALEPAKSEPSVALKRRKYCFAVTRAIIQTLAVLDHSLTSNQSVAKPEAHHFYTHAGIIHKLFCSVEVAMLRTAVRRFSAEVSKQRPKRHHKKKNHFATAGLPLVLFIVGGYVALTQFVGGKYEARDHMVKSQSEHLFNLEEEHKKMTKKLTLDDFEIKPVPKPKEDP